MKPLSLVHQTAFAELVDRCRLAEFDRDFAPQGSFVRIEKSGKGYWYFKIYSEGKNRSKYVGPDSPALRDRIALHGRIKADHNERKSIVAGLKRAGLPAPDDMTGAVCEALAQAGAFRLGACLVGTAAFQTYPGLLGAHFPGVHMRTADLDIAQFYGVSIAVEDSTPPIAEILAEVDPTFRPVPHIADRHASTAFVNRAGYRIEFLTPNRGRQEIARKPVRLKALAGTGAEALRFLDFLIREPVSAALLYRGGVLVNVPSPERYAVHKLIVATRRRESAAKIDKDVAQAATLIEVMAAKRAHVLRDACQEAEKRGPKWRAALADGAAMMSGATRAVLGSVTQAPSTTRGRGKSGASWRPRRS